MMNTPNKLTLLRVLLIPLFMLCFLQGEAAGLYLAILVFLIATATDNLDGHLARKYNQVTTFGKLMDPLADKLLITAALVCFLAKDCLYINVWVVMVILARELIVTGIRMIALGDAKVIAASMWGKAKTVSQFIMVVLVMVNEIIFLHIVGGVMVYNYFVLLSVVVATALTIFSGIDYAVKNRNLIQFK